MIEHEKKYKEYYLKTLPPFLDEIESLGDFGLPSGLFLSHPLPDYGRTGPKVFYIGRDTKGWHNYTEMMNLFRTGKIIDYLKQYWPTNSREMMAWGDRMTFWTVVFKLHIYLNHNGICHPKIQDYSDEEKKCLTSLGFGNMNCVEVPQTLQKIKNDKQENYWGLIDRGKYREFKSKSRRFDRLKLILDLYEPDVVYIFSWPLDKIFMDGLELVEDGSLHEDHKRRVFNVKGYKTKIIQTSHPTYFLFRITHDINKVVEYLGDTYMKLK